MGNPDLLFSFLRYISTLKAILPNQQGASCWIPQYSLRPHPHPFVQADNSHSYSRSETLLLPPTTHKWTHSFTLRGAQVLIYRRHSLYSILSNSYILILTGTFSGLQLPQFADLQSLLRLIHGTGQCWQGSSTSAPGTWDKGCSTADKGMALKLSMYESQKFIACYFLQSSD